MEKLQGPHRARTHTAVPRRAARCWGSPTMRTRRRMSARPEGAHERPAPRGGGGGGRKEGSGEAAQAGRAAPGLPLPRHRQSTGTQALDAGKIEVPSRKEQSNPTDPGFVSS